VGYAVAQRGSSIACERTWQLSAQGPLLAVTGRDNARSTSSSIKVQGDRSMRMRYLNPNSALIVSGAASGAGCPCPDVASTWGTRVSQGALANTCRVAPCDAMRTCVWLKMILTIVTISG
jgi:hypothetical protein